MLSLVLGAAMSLSIRTASGSYEPLTSASAIPATGITELRLRIEGPVSSPLRLHFSRYVERVEASITLQNGGSLQEVAGTSIPYDDRAVRTIDPVLPLPDGMAIPATIDVRVLAEDPRFALPTLETNYPENPPSEPDVFYVLAVGLLLGLVLYHFGLYVVLREFSLALYVATLATFILYELTASGLAWLYLWPHASIPASAALRVCALIVTIAVMFFSRSFLRSEEYAPLADRCFVAAVVFTAVATAASLIIPSMLGFAALAANIGLLLAALSVSIAAIFCLQNGVRSAGYFLVGVGGLFIGALITAIFDDVGGLQSGAHAHGIELGVCFNAIVLAMGMADRVRIEARDRQRIESVASEHEHLAKTDALTNIANRRHFDERLRIEWNRATRHSGELAVLMIDIDRFKLFNQALGQLAGDSCLRSVAAAVDAVILRADDVFARYGGEEFAAILPGSNLTSAKAVAELVRLAIKNLAIAHPGGGILSVSIGIASAAPSVHFDPETLLADADAALYRAKQHGGNCIEVSTSPT